MGRARRLDRGIKHLPVDVQLPPPCSIDHSKAEKASAVPITTVVDDIGRGPIDAYKSLVFRIDMSK